MTEAQIQYRYRLTFAKIDSLRFIGHLDLAKTWERVFRRAALNGEGSGAGGIWLAGDTRS